MASKGYLLGKLFALLEREGVVRMEQYQQASVSPLAIVPAFTRLAETGKLDSIAEVMSELPSDAFNDQGLSPSDQADFPLGYYHQKARFLPRNDQIDEEEQFTAQLLIRLEPSLKKWTMEQGGSSFVRSLLKSKRAESN